MGNNFSENDIIEVTDTIDRDELIRLVMMVSLVVNDIKHLHFHVTGSGFDTLHADVFNDYYNTASDDLDYICEIALEECESIPNLSTALKYNDGYEIQSKSLYTYDSAISSMSHVLIEYAGLLSELRSLFSGRTDIESWLDDRIRFWNKELKYKNSRRNNQHISDNDIIDVTEEATQPGAIGQHKNTNTETFPPLKKKRDQEEFI